MADLVNTADLAAVVADPERSVLPVGPAREYALIPLDQIQVHPLNLRRELRGIDELADSIHQNGLLEPVLLVPAPDPSDERYVLIAGHRRHRACVAVKHDPVEAIVRRDLDSEGAQVIAMLTENGPRDDLTPIEEAHGYQLALSLNGFTPTRLAKRLGKPRATIASRIALTRLPDHVQDQVHARQITLHEAEVLVEFANDSHVFEDLLARAGTQGFQYRVEQERRAREVCKQIAEVRRDLEATGVRVIDPPDNYSWGSAAKPVGLFVDPSAPPGDDGTPGRFTAAAHASACSFHGVFVNPNSIKPEYVCTNPAEAGHIRPAVRSFPAPAVAAASDDSVTAPTREQAVAAAEEAERERAEAERMEAERREAIAVAGRLRGAFLTSTVRRGGRAHLVAVLRLLLDEHLRAFMEDASLEEVDELAGLIDARLTPATGEEETVDDRLAVVERDLFAALDTRRTADALAGALLAIAAQGREWALCQGHGWGIESCRRYVQFLVAQGYELTDIERELLDRYDPETSGSTAVATA